MEIKVIKTNGGLFPFDDDDYKMLKRIKEGQPCKVTVKNTRNIYFHRKYFALINTAWEYLTERQERLYGTKEAFRKTLQIAAGYFEPLFDMQEGRFIKSPSSIAFDKMTEEEFEDLYDRVKDVLLQSVLTHITENELLTNIADF